MAHKKVIGIGYDADTDAVPTVILKSVGADAEAALAQAHKLGNVPIVSDPHLVDQLYRVPLDAPISRDLFTAMAALLAHVIQLDHKEGDSTP
jgi:type III secretion system FlhB-like substrate exporter